MHATLPLLAALAETPAGPSSLQLGSYLGLSALVIGVLAAGGLGLNRMVRGGWRLKSAQRSLRVLDLLPLPAKQQLAVVQVYDRTLVLGVGSSGVRLVAEWDADGPLPSGPAPAAPTRAPRSERARALLAILGARPAPTAQDRVHTPALSTAHDPFAAQLEAALERVLPRVAATQQPAAVAPTPVLSPAVRRVRREAAGASNGVIQAAQPRRTEAARAREPQAAPETAATRAAASQAGERAATHPTIDELLRAEGVFG